MNRIPAYIPWARIAALPFILFIYSCQSLAAAENSARSRFIEQRYGSEEAAKSAICEKQAAMGEAMAARYKSFKATSARSQAEFSNVVHGGQQYPKDSLRRENIEVGLQQVYKGSPAKKVVATMLEHCLQHDMVYIENLDQSKATVASTLLVASKRSSANCSEKVQALSQAVMAHEMGRPDKEIKESLARIGDNVLENKMYKALKSSQETFFRLFNQFENECGFSKSEIQAKRKAAANDICQLDIETLWDMGEAYYENQKIEETREKLMQHISDSKIVDALIKSLKTSEDKFFNTVDSLQDDC